MRALMLFARTAQPSDELDDPSGYDLSALDTCIDAHVGHLMHRIRLTCAPLLMKLSVADTKVCEDKLHSIVRGFVEAGIRINAQNPRTSTLFRNKMVKYRFADEDPRFKACRALKLQEDEGDGFPNAREAGLEGRGIDLVVEPGIVRVGDKDGINYDRPKVLIKAFVWMVRDEDLRNKATFAPPDEVMAAQPAERPEEPTMLAEASAKIDEPQSKPATAKAHPENDGNEQKTASLGSIEDAAPSMCTRNKKRLSQASGSPNKKRCTSAPEVKASSACTSNQDQRVSSVSRDEKEAQKRKDVPAGQKEISKQGQTIKVESVVTVTTTDASRISQGVGSCLQGHPNCLSHRE